MLHEEGVDFFLFFQVAAEVNKIDRIEQKSLISFIVYRSRNYCAGNFWDVCRDRRIPLQYLPLHPRSDHHHHNILRCSQDERAALFTDVGWGAVEERFIEGLQPSIRHSMQTYCLANWKTSIEAFIQHADFTRRRQVEIAYTKDDDFQRYFGFNAGNRSNTRLMIPV